MIKACEARRKTTENLEKMISNEISQIDHMIVTAVQDGKYYVSIDGNMSKEAENTLVDSGYYVERGAQYNEPYCIVKWR